MLNFGGAFGGVAVAIARVRAVAKFFPKLGRGHNTIGLRCRACKPGNEETRTHTAFVFDQALNFLRKQEEISVDHGVDRHLAKLARRIGRKAPGTMPYELVIRRGTRRRKPQATPLVPAASYERF